MVVIPFRLMAVCLGYEFRLPSIAVYRPDECWEVESTEVAKLRRAVIIQNEAVPSKYVYRLPLTWQKRWTKDL